jgi:hypothetical protein
VCDIAIDGSAVDTVHKQSVLRYWSATGLHKQQHCFLFAVNEK